VPIPIVSPTVQRRVDELMTLCEIAHGTLIACRCL
jgi:hypothetical protein